jgi:hypothetical protein
MDLEKDFIIEVEELTQKFLHLIQNTYKNIDLQKYKTFSSTKPPLKEEFESYLKGKFPNFQFEAKDGHYEIVVDGIDFDVYTSFEHFDFVFKLTEDIRSKFNWYYKNSSLGHLAVALACIDSNYRHTTKFGKEALDIIKEYLNSDFISLFHNRCAICGNVESDTDYLIKGSYGCICDKCILEISDIVNNYKKKDGDK